MGPIFFSNILGTIQLLMMIFFSLQLGNELGISASLGKNIIITWATDAQCLDSEMSDINGAKTKQIV